MYESYLERRVERLDLVRPDDPVEVLLLEHQQRAVLPRDHRRHPRLRHLAVSVPLSAVFWYAYPQYRYPYPQYRYPYPQYFGTLIRSIGTLIRSIGTLIRGFGALT